MPDITILGGAYDVGMWQVSNGTGQDPRFNRDTRVSGISECLTYAERRVVSVLEHESMSGELLVGIRVTCRWVVGTYIIARSLFPWHHPFSTDRKKTHDKTIRKSKDVRSAGYDARRRYANKTLIENTNEAALLSTVVHGAETTTSSSIGIA